MVKVCSGDTFDPCRSDELGIIEANCPHVFIANLALDLFLSRCFISFGKSWAEEALPTQRVAEHQEVMMIDETFPNHPLHPKGDFEMVYGY